MTKGGPTLSCRLPVSCRLDRPLRVLRCSASSHVLPFGGLLFGLAGAAASARHRTVLRSLTTMLLASPEAEKCRAYHTCMSDSASLPSKIPNPYAETNFQLEAFGSPHIAVLPKDSVCPPWSDARRRASFHRPFCFGSVREKTIHVRLPNRRWDDLWGPQPHAASCCSLTCALSVLTSPSTGRPVRAAGRRPQASVPRSSPFCLCLALRHAATPNEVNC